MSFESDPDNPINRFVSESELKERQNRRQEEWEKVRKPEDPLEVPEEEYDPKSLYERLQEQKDKKEAELEESRRLKNLIKGLDDDEVSFLELVDKTKIQMETKLWQEEMKEIEEFKKAVADLSEAESEAKLQQLRKTLQLPANSQLKKSPQAMLASAVKRKQSNELIPPEKKHCTGLSSTVNGDAPNDRDKAADVEAANVQNSSPSLQKVPENYRSRNKIGALHCLGILPGLGAYTDSSDSENSSNSDGEKESEYDLVGRKIVLATIAPSKS